MQIFVEGIGLIAPGLNGWTASVPILAGNAPYQFVPLAIPVLEMLPPAERRRTPTAVKLALATGWEALANAGQAPSETASVFTSSGGDGDVIHQICDSLTQPEREVSPTRFHNSVHNAPAGYWGIATGARETSTSLCAYDASFAAGMIEAAAQVAVEVRNVLLIAYDAPYPEPLNGVRQIGAATGVALLLSPRQTTRTLCKLDVALIDNGAAVTKASEPALENLRQTVPAARALPLLSAIARNEASRIVTEYLGANVMQVTVTPCK